MKKFLTKKNIIIGIIIFVLLFVVVIKTMFFKNVVQKNPDDSNNQVILPEDELEFTNESDMNVDTIINLVNGKRADLRALFYESSVYEANEIDAKKYTKEDNLIYVVFDETFLHKLNDLVIDTLYQEFFNQMTLIKQDKKHSYYISERTIFNRVYTASSIAEAGVTEEYVRMMKSTNDSINASVYINACLSEEPCKNENTYPFELIKMNELWKISVIY